MEHIQTILFLFVVGKHVLALVVSMIAAAIFVLIIKDRGSQRCGQQRTSHGVTESRVIIIVTSLLRRSTHSPPLKERQHTLSAASTTSGALLSTCATSTLGVGSDMIKGAGEKTSNCHSCITSKVEVYDGRSPRIYFESRTAGEQRSNQVTYQSPCAVCISCLADVAQEPLVQPV